MSTTKRALCLMMSVLVLYGGALAENAPLSSDTAADTAAADTYQKQPYAEYLKALESRTMSSQEIQLTPGLITGKETVNVIEGIDNVSTPCVETDESGYVEYSFDVTEAGFFNINLQYYNKTGKGSSIVRCLKIDGDIPFEEARELYFRRIFTNSEPVKRDKADNDIRPSQKEVQKWQTVDFTDASGFYSEPLKFYFSAGQHTLRLESIREPMIIGGLKLHAAERAKPYAEAAEGYAVPHGRDTYEKLQGEEALYKSDAMLYPSTDRSGVDTEFNDPAKIRINTIGGDRWQMPGQWLSWKVTVDSDGLYKLGIKARQNLISGAASTRALYINGEIPFGEAGSIKFQYDTAWSMTFLKNGEEDMLFPLKAGENEIKLLVTLGDLGGLQQEVNDCMMQLNESFRQILMITGPVPDLYRDYQFHKQIPDTLAKMEEQGLRLDGLYEEYKTVTGQNGEQAQTLIKLSRQLAEIVKNPSTIPNRFSALKGNIGALGTWLLEAKRQPLEIDYLVIASPEQDIDYKPAGFFSRLWFMVQAFFASFSNDYTSVGSTGESDRVITVWLGNGQITTGTEQVTATGRDQANVIKKLAESGFSPQQGIGVNIQLVASSSLLTATLANKGPDVALSVPGGELVNYGVRNAVIDLAPLPDFEEVTGRFMPSAMIPISYGGKAYALPETQTFFMMFYRKDILNDLKLNVPKTWDEVIAMLPRLQEKQLNFGLSQPIGDAVGTGFSTYAMLLFQEGGYFYNGEGETSALDNSQAIDAFTKWVKYYTDYNLPTTYDFINRFRVGEIPIGIIDYTSYNTLSVFAPEINGLWEFGEVPGVRQPDGTINNVVAGSVNACCIMTGTKDKPAAWEFLKWWTSDQTQTDYALELENVMGTAARYAPANIKALYSIPWPKKEFDKILNQWQKVVAVPNVPGAYFTGRYIDFALRDALTGTKDAGECLEDAARKINSELQSKREELNLNIK